MLITYEKFSLFIWLFDSLLKSGIPKLQPIYVEPKFFIITVNGSLLKVFFLVIYWLIQAGQHRNFSSILGVWSTPHTFLCSHAQSPSWQVELKNSQGQVTEFVEVFSPCKTDSSVYCYGKESLLRTGRAIILYLSTTIQRKDNYASLYGGHKLYFNFADI